MYDSLDKLNITLISGSNKDYSLYSVTPPRDLIDGTKSAGYNCISGIVTGLTTLVITPISRYNDNEGVYGVLMGTAQGILFGSVLSFIGVVTGIYQFTRGCINTPFSINEYIKGKSWNYGENQWEHYNHETENEIFKSIDVEYKSKSIPQDTKLYDLLELDYEASKSDIKKNYYKLAKKYHPDKNVGDEQAHSKFQELGEAYYILSNNDLREKYDNNSLSDNESEIDSKKIFEVLFGSDLLQDFIGDLYIYTFVTSKDNDQLVFKQRKREIDIVNNMIKHMEYYINGDINNFIINMTQIISELKESNIVTFLIGVIGYIYIEQGNYYSSGYKYLYLCGKEKIHNMNNNFKVLKSSLKLSKNMIKVNKDIDDTDIPIDEDEYDIININKEYKNDMFENVIDVSWYLTISDIEYILRKSCWRLLNDTSVDKNIRQARAEGLVLMGQLLIEESNITNEECLSVLKYKFNNQRI